MRLRADRCEPGRLQSDSDGEGPGRMRGEGSRLSLFTDFGLRALMRMASAPARAYSTAELAEEFGISRNHLSKIVQFLARAGIFSTRRGGGGGAMIARPPGEIRLGEVVRLLESGQALV